MGNADNDRPSQIEFISGAIVLMVLAGVVLTRGGSPRSGLAAPLPALAAAPSVEEQAPESAEREPSRDDSKPAAERTDANGSDH